MIEHRLIEQMIPIIHDILKTIETTIGRPKKVTKNGPIMDPPQIP
jgi:hypothetical protein